MTILYSYIYFIIAYEINGRNIGRHKPTGPQISSNFKLLQFLWVSFDQPARHGAVNSLKSSPDLGLELGWKLPALMQLRNLSCDGEHVDFTIYFAQQTDQTNEI